MNAKREPYLIIKKENQSLMERKIKHLSQIGQRQSHKIKELLAQENAPYPSHRRNILTQRTQNDFKSAIPTARKRYRCQDYEEKQQQRVKAMERGQYLVANQIVFPNPVLHLPIQNKQQDKELQYLKSDEYKKYLEALANHPGRQERVRTIKENRNHSIYLGKGDRKQYIQSIIKTGQVLPRVNLQIANIQSQFYQSKQYNYTYTKPDIRHQNQLRLQKILQNQKKQPTTYQVDSQSPIKQVYHRQIINQHSKQSNQSVVLSPVRQKKNQENQYLKRERGKQKFQKKQFKLMDTSPLQDYIKNVPTKFEQKLKSKISPHVKNDTYRKQLEYCEKRNKTERANRVIKANNKENTYIFKIEQDKENQERKKVYSPKLSTSSKFSQKEKHTGKENAYEISFKIEKPDQKYQPYSNKKYNNIVKQVLPKQKIMHHKSSTQKKNAQGRQRIFTEYIYDQPLHLSHTNSTATKEGELYNNSKTNHKITIVSKSKHKR